jgi:hypothetical protein
MICDFCNRTISASEVVVISLHEMQQAVRNGFNPWKTPGLDMSSTSGLASAFGFSSETVFAHWRQRVMTDTTDWGLCPTCAEAFRNATGSQLQGPVMAKGEGPRTWLDFYNLCLAAKERGDFQLALELGEKALELCPQDLRYDKRALSLYPVIDALRSQLRYISVHQGTRDSNSVIEIPLGARFEYYKRFFNMPFLDIYRQQDRSKIMEKFRMPATSSNDSLALENMSISEFLIRVVYFGRAFSEGKLGLGDSEISDFLGLEPILGMLDCENDAVNAFCLNLLEQYAAQKILPRELTKVFSRLESMSVKLGYNSAMIKVFESMWKSWPLMKELGQKETDTELLPPLVDFFGNVGDAGTAELLCGLLKKQNLTPLWPEIQKALVKISSENKKYFSAFPRVTCKKCSAKGVKVKYRVGLIKSYEFVLCPRCKMSSSLK